jgi:hypothetical protein
MQRVLSQDTQAASLVAQLLRSCLNEMRRKGGQPDALNVMSELDRIVQQAVSPSAPNSAASLPALNTATPGSPPRFPGPSPSSVELPGPPPRRETGNAAPLPRLPPRASNSMRPASRTRSASPHSGSASPLRSNTWAAGSSIGGSIWRSSNAYATASLQDIIGDESLLDGRVARVAPALCISGLPARVSLKELQRAVSNCRRLLNVELHSSGRAIMQFSSMPAAISCFGMIRRVFDRIGWNAADVHFAAHLGDGDATRPEGVAFLESSEYSTECE